MFLKSTTNALSDKSHNSNTHMHSCLFNSHSVINAMWSYQSIGRTWPKKESTAADTVKTSTDSCWDALGVFHRPKGKIQPGRSNQPNFMYCLRGILAGT